MAKKKSDNDGNHSEDSEGGGVEEPNFDDPEDFVDDISDEDLLADLLSQKPCETDGVESVVVVDNIPVVVPQRQDKLKSVVEKIFSSPGEIANVYYALDEEGNTKGFAFVEYKNPESAERAVENLKQHRLDRAHTFSVNFFTDFQKYEHIPENWEPPTTQPYKIQKDLYKFISEPDAYDQFCVAVDSGSNSVQVQFWQNTLPEPTDLETRESFTDTFVKWSPKGTYIVTFHKLGVALWGGEKFTRINKFPHVDTQFVDFSPNEQYLVTYGPTSTGQKIVIWDIRTGQEKRSFESEVMNNMSMFRWSHDDQFFARMFDNSIHVYETTTFFLLDLKSIKVPGIQNFSWSPTDNVIAYWVAEEIDVPAMVRILEIPKKRQIRSKNLFNVSDCKIHWQKSGDYLCVKVDRFTKSRKDKKDADVKFLGMSFNFEIFHMREKDIPVDSVEIKDTILAFAWEPVGTKFAIIHGESSNATVSFYEVKIGQTPVLCKKLEKKMCTHLFWSPRGQFIVLANLSMGTFEFVDTENDFVIMNSGDHYRASDVHWDPTGRYCVTGVSAWKVKEDHGYNIWSFQGKVLRRVLLSHFIQFLWRPRPVTLLTEEHQLKIKKGLKKYYPQFEHKDRIRMSRASKELLEKRAQLRNQFNEYRNKKILQWNEQKEKRLELRDNIDTDNMFADDVEEEIEFLIKEDKNIIE